MTASNFKKSLRNSQRFTLSIRRPRNAPRFKRKSKETPTKKPKLRNLETEKWGSKFHETWLERNYLTDTACKIWWQAKSCTRLSSREGNNGRKKKQESVRRARWTSRVEKWTATSGRAWCCAVDALPDHTGVKKFSNMTFSTLILRKKKISQRGLTEVDLIMEGQIIVFFKRKSKWKDNYSDLKSTPETGQLSLSESLTMVVMVKSKPWIVPSDHHFTKMCCGFFILIRYDY